MTRTVAAISLLVVCFVPLRAADPVPRVQKIGETTYFHLTLPIPDAAAVPKSLRQAVEKIALDDLAWQPRLVPMRENSAVPVWRAANARALEFVGRVGSENPTTFTMMVPVEEKEKRTWAATPVTVDFSKGIRVNPPKDVRTPLRSPVDDDLEGLWAAATVRDFAVRERVAGGFEYFRVARQALCRRYAVADPMPRPEMIGPVKPNVEAAVELGQLPEIEAGDHPWGPLLAGRKPVIEPLARFVPRDCYYLRMSDAAKFESVARPLLEWAPAVAAWIDGDGRDYRLLERYQRQMLFPIDAAGRPRMPKYVHEFAVIGSDPHLRTGTDVTVLCRMSNTALFREEMGERISGRVLHKDYRGTDVESIVDSNREISMYRAFIDGVAIYSNSAAAIWRSIDAQASTIPNLAEAPDFRLFRAALADDIREDAVLFVSESFLRRQYSPGQVIAMRRREEAIAFLKALQYAGLFIREDTGRPPKDLAQILGVAGVKPDDPRLGRWAITWDAERQQVRSGVNGTVAFATPLIETQPVKVTGDERESYLAFLDDARKNVIPLLAPVGVWLRVDDVVRANVFAMPPSRAATWDVVRRRLGPGEVERPTAAPNCPARLVAAVASEPNDQDFVKDMLIKFGADPKLFQKHPDWRGERLTLHLDDGPALAKAIEHFLDDPSGSPDKQADRLVLAQLPATLGVEIRRPLIFLAWLTRVKEILTQSFPNILTWDALPGMPRGAKVNRVHLNQATMFLLFGKLLQPADAPAVYYANNNRALLIGLNPVAINNTVARELVGEERGVRRRRRGADWVNAALDVNPAAASEAMAALRSALDHGGQRRSLAATELRRVLGRAGVGEPDSGLGAVRQFGFAPAGTTDGVRKIDGVKRIAAELRIRPDGMLLTVSAERDRK
jgi:hypothetical protein